MDESLTPEQRALRSRIGGHVMHSRHNSRAVSQPGRDAFLARFEREVDPEGKLPVEERRRRAAHARKAYMQQLALKSAKARRKRSTGEEQR